MPKAPRAASSLNASSLSPSCASSDSTVRRVSLRRAQWAAGRLCQSWELFEQGKVRSRRGLDEDRQPVESERRQPGEVSLRRPHQRPDVRLRQTADGPGQREVEPEAVQHPRISPGPKQLLLLCTQRLAPPMRELRVCQRSGQVLQTAHTVSGQRSQFNRGLRRAQRQKVAEPRNLKIQPFDGPVLATDVANALAQGPQVKPRCQAPRRLQRGVPAIAPRIGGQGRHGLGRQACHRRLSQRYAPERAAAQPLAAPLPPFGTGCRRSIEGHPVWRDQLRRHGRGPP